MTKRSLTLGIWDYDRVAALSSGVVQPEGIDLNCIIMPPEETFFRMARHAEFDIAEMSLSSYSLTLHRDNPPFIAIPVFPSRFFRHSCIFISTRGQVKEPKDLLGAKVGIPEYQMTAPVWIRGIIADEYGVKPEMVNYFTGGEEHAGRIEKLKLNLPERFKVAAIGAQQTLSSMLAQGEIDALYTARTPSTFHTQPDKVQRLFSNYMEIERDYFRRTKVFPIMHCVVIRRELYKESPWIAQSLYKAFVAAQRKTYHDMADTAALKTMFPWANAYQEQTRQEFGDDWWPYGFQANRHVLDTFLRYHHEQGLSPTRLAPEALFAPETFDSFVI